MNLSLKIVLECGALKSEYCKLIQPKWLVFSACAKCRKGFHTTSLAPNPFLARSIRQPGTSTGWFLFHPTKLAALFAHTVFNWFHKYIHLLIYQKLPKNYMISYFKFKWGSYCSCPTLLQTVAFYIYICDLLHDRPQLVVIFEISYVVVFTPFFYKINFTFRILIFVYVYMF